MGRAYSPSRKPFLKRRGRCLRYLMRPVPVVRRPIAFTDQLSERKRGKGGRVSVRSGIVGGVVANPRPLRSVSRWEEGSGGVLTVALAGGGVTARAAGGLLDVVSTTSTPVGASRMRWSVEFRDGTEVAALKKRGCRSKRNGPGLYVPPAESVRLVMTLTERAGTLSDLTHAGTLTTWAINDACARCKRATTGRDARLKPKNSASKNPKLQN